MISLGGGGAGGSSLPSSSKSSHRAKPPQTNKWRTGTQQKIYGRRLLDALRATGTGGGGGGAPQPRAVKEAADSALALTARGQTRWSRAILLSTCRRRRVLVKAGGKIRKRHHRRPTKAPALEPPALKERKVKERLRVLGRLVPGCRKLPAPALLEETADYVAALEMQVKTMRALADALAAAQLRDDDGEMES